VGVDVRSEISEHIASRTIARVDVHRRKASRDAAVNKSRERVERIELVALIRNQSATEERIEKVLAAHCDCQSFVGLTREQRPVLSCSLPHTLVAHVFSRTAREEAVRDTEFDLVRVGDCVGVVEANDAIEVIDAGKSSIDQVRLDQVSKEKPVTAMKVSCERR